MKIINFTAKPCLKSLLRKIKESTIRPIPKNGKPRFIENEKFKILWNQRSTYSCFCPKCGEPTDHPELAYCKSCFGVVRPFAKLLGYGTITNVDKIEIGLDQKSKLGFYLYLNKYLNEDEITALSEKDGFERVDDFFEWFKRYDLRTPNEFYLYKWKWVDENKSKIL